MNPQYIKSSSNQVVPLKALETCPKYGFYVFAFTDDGRNEESASLRRNGPGKRVFGMITNDGETSILNISDVKGVNQRELSALHAQEGVRVLAKALTNWIDHNSGQAVAAGTEACRQRFAMLSSRFHKITSVGWGKTFSDIRKWYYTGENPIAAGKERTRLWAAAREQAARIAKEQKARREVIEIQSKQLYNARYSQGIVCTLEECIKEITEIYDSVNS